MTLRILPLVFARDRATSTTAIVNGTPLLNNLCKANPPTSLNVSFDIGPVRQIRAVALWHFLRDVTIQKSPETDSSGRRVSELAVNCRCSQALRASAFVGYCSSVPTSHRGGSFCRLPHIPASDIPIHPVRFCVCRVASFRADNESSLEPFSFRTRVAGPL